MYRFLSVFLVPPLPCSLFWEDVVLSPFKKDCVLPSYLHSLLFCRRYLITEFPGGSLLRIEPARKKRDDSAFECVAENGVGDEVSAKAQLHVIDGEHCTSLFCMHMI